MYKNLQIVLITGIILMLFIVSCAPKPTVAPPIAEEEEVAEVAETPPKEVSITGEKSVDEVGTDISDASSIDEELDTTDLDDIDSILADIENI